MANSVYFYKVRKTSTGNISVITSDKPLTAIKTNDTLGFEVGSRGSGATFGVFTPRDPETGQVSKANSKMHQNFSGLEQGQEMPGFRMTHEPVLKEDGSESGLYWVEVV